MNNNVKSICVLTNLSLEVEPTVSNRLSPYITESLNRGVCVTLVSGDKRAINYEGSFHHIGVGATELRPSSFIKRAVFEWKEARKLLKQARGGEFDLYIVTIPSMFLLFNLGLLKNEKVLLDVRDLTWEYLRDFVFLERIAKILFRLLASRAYKMVSNVAVTNDAELSYFNHKHIKAEKYSNGVSSSQFHDLCNLPDLRSEGLVVSYVGKVGLAQNLTVLICVAERLPLITFNIVGYGPLSADLEKMVLSKGVTNINFVGKVNWKGVLEYYAKSDVLYAQLSSNYSGAVPSKLYQYLSTRRYVIYGGVGEAIHVLSKFDNNIVIPPDNENALYQSLLEIEKRNVNISSNINVEIIKREYVREESVRGILEEVVFK